MPKASNSRARVSADKQLADVDVCDAKRRWKAQLPCTLKQTAVALEVSYSVARNWAKMAQFPMLKGFVFPSSLSDLSKSFGKRI